MQGEPARASSLAANGNGAKSHLVLVAYRPSSGWAESNGLRQKVTHSSLAALFRLHLRVGGRHLDRLSSGPGSVGRH